MESLKVSLINPSSSEFQKFKHWRNSYIGENPANESNFEFWETVRDECSYIFGFYRNNQLVGGVRFTPIGHGLTMGERLLSIDRWGIQSNPGVVLDVNRLVVDVAVRGGNIMKNALLECFRWVKENSTHSTMVAVCNESLVPLYAKVGAKLVHADVSSPTISSKKYSLIALNLGEMYG